MHRSTHLSYLVVTLAFLVSLAGSAWGYVPPVEIRCYLAAPTGVGGTLTLPDLTFKQSNIRQRFVCPHCGYSQRETGTCPNPWALAAHPAAVVLEDLGASRARLVSLSSWDMPADQSDIRWYDRSAGTALYAAVVGLPFHPTTYLRSPQTDPVINPADPRSYRRTVYVRVAVTPPVDVDGDGSTAGPGDIWDATTLFRLVFTPIGDAFPAADPSAAADAWTSPPGTATDGVFATPGAAPRIGAGEQIKRKVAGQSSGIGRVFLQWSNDGGLNWRWNASEPPAGPPAIYAAYYVSRLQIPWTQDTWRNGQAEQAAFGAGAYTSGSFLARVLADAAAPTTPQSAARNDLFTPGAATPRRHFSLINRSSAAATPLVPLVDLQATLLETLTTPPGVTAAGREALRPALPESAVRLGPFGSPTEGPNSPAGYGVGALSPSLSPEITAPLTDPPPGDSTHWVQFLLPPGTPSSEGGDTLPSSPVNNWGYRSLALIYNDLWPSDTTRTNSRTNNGRWDFRLSDGLDDAGSTAPDLIEEFSPFDLQVSVDKQAGMLAASGTAEPGRVSPGVWANAPDTTTTAVPAGRYPFGTNVSLNGPFVVTNLGNVSLPPHLVWMNQASALPVEASNRTRSLARLLAANPLWLPMAAYSSLPASLLPGLSGAPAGGGSPGLAWQGSLNDPLPLGQALGQYSGQVVPFLDLNGNGVLDFINGITGLPTTTATTAFDPSRDEPLEPVTSVPTSLRVTETRLPFNDFYAADTEPVLRFDPSISPTQLQFIWVSNRASAATGGGSVNTPAPAATDLTGAARPAYPGNLLFGNATLGGAGDYRNWVWGEASYNAYSAYAGTRQQAADVPGAVNSSPMTFNDLDGRHWLFWHRTLPRGGGLESTLRWEGSTDAGWAGPEAALLATGLQQRGLRGFADPAGNGVWLFWSQGEEGHQRLYYRWNFTGTATAANEAPLPVTNAVAADQREDLITDFTSGQIIRKPPAGPFTYAKDPSAFLWTDRSGAATPLSTQLNVIFSGYLSRQQNEDLCWAAFDQATLQDGTQNFGKLTFPRVANNQLLPAIDGAGTAWAGELLETNGLRQVFSSRHLDWLITRDFATTPLAGTDPAFYLTLTVGGTPWVYTVSWTGGSYDRARGLYTVTPTFTPVAAGAPWAGGPLTNPATAGGPVTMQMEPATGTVTFSTALFNVSRWGDPGAVFNTTVVGLGGLTDVQLLADYTPFILRITTSDANDDCPNAFAEVSADDFNQLRLVFLWRRTHSQKDTPHFGRTSFMYKTWTLGTQVAYPPFGGGAPTVAYWDGAAWQNLTLNTHYTQNAGSGIISMAPTGSYVPANSQGVFWLNSPFDGVTLRISYADVNGVNRQEQQRVIGWSREVPVPVDTVHNEGPLRAVPEVYTVSNGAGGAMAAVRYWLTWASPRPVYDLRLPAANAAGSLLHQTTDIYCATLVPSYGQALREQEVP